MLTFIASSLLAISVARAEAPSAEFQQQATGHFVLSEQQAAVQAQLDAAVTRTVEALPWLIRPLARYKLGGTVRACPSYRLVLSAESFTVSCDGEEPFTRPFAQTRMQIFDDGDPYDVVLRIAEKVVTLSFMGEKGGKSDTYGFDGAGAMTVSSRITSSMLSEPLAWKLKYRKLE